MSGDDKVTKLLRTYLWEIQREKRGDIYREGGNIEILKIKMSGKYLGGKVYTELKTTITITITRQTSLRHFS